MNLVNQDSIALHCIVEKLKLMHIHSQWRAPTLQGTIENGKPFQYKHVGELEGGKGAVILQHAPFIVAIRNIFERPQ